VTDPNEPDSPSGGPSDGPSTRPPDEPKIYISSRLREKLMETEGEEEWSPKGGLPITGIIVGVVVLAVLVGGVMFLRSAAKAQKAKEDAAAAAAARADSLANLARADSLRVAAQADSMARAVADSVARKHGKLPPKSATAAAPSAGSAGASSAGTAAATPPPESKTDGFGIGVGTFLDEGRAKSELDRLSGSTSLTGLVAPTKDGSFQVILGKFGSRGAADKKAVALADSGLVREAHVVVRPKL
jgi:hypothetical protein